jgi:hypothetical protein
MSMAFGAAGGLGCAARPELRPGWMADRRDMHVHPARTLDADNWRHAISIGEVILGPSANEDLAGGTRPVETGPRLLARIELA